MRDESSAAVPQNPQNPQNPQDPQDPGDREETIETGARAGRSVRADARDLDERLAVAAVELEAEAVIRPPAGVRARGDQRRQRKAVTLVVTPVAVLALTGGVALAMRPPGGVPVSPGGSRQMSGGVHATEPDPAPAPGGSAATFPSSMPSSQPLTLPALSTVPITTTFVQQTKPAAAPRAVVNLARREVAFFDVEGAVTHVFPITAGGKTHPTRTGSFTVVAKKPAATFGSASVGLDAVPHDFYDLTVAWYLDLGANAPGIYAMPWQSNFVGRSDVTHGDIGLGVDDAAKLYGLLAVGDRVEIADGPV